VVIARSGQDEGGEGGGKEREGRPGTVGEVEIDGTADGLGGGWKG